MIPTVLWKRPSSQEAWAAVVGIIVVIVMLVTMP